MNIWMMVGVFSLGFIVLMHIFAFFRKLNTLTEQSAKIVSVDSNQNLVLWKLNEIIKKLDSIISDTNSQDDKIWEFLMERAKTSVLKEGLGKMNSPLVINPQIRKLFIPLDSELKAFYQNIGKNLTETQFYREISHVFGKQLQEQICIPLGFTNGECVFLAAHIAQESDNEPEQESPSI